MLSNILNSFGTKLRNIFWPIHRHELNKFVPMAVLMFFILFNQNMLRILKDSIVIAEISAEVTSFAKVYCVTPVAALFVILYAKMVNSLSFERIFNYLQWTFVGFFGIFAFMIYPNSDFFHMDSVRLEELMNLHPHFKWFIALFGYWSYIIFYVLAELWPNIFYILLFWQFANEITTTQEAKRFYTLFSLFGNSSLIIVGYMMMNLASEHSVLKEYFDNMNEQDLLVESSIGLVIISSFICSLLVRFVHIRVMNDPSLYLKAKADNTPKEKMGVRESFRYIARSKYLWLLLICSAAFGLSMNLVEAVWKSKMKELYSTVNAYAQFNGLIILWTGVAIMVMTIIGNNIMRRHNWFVAAVITPIIIGITGVAFFVLVIFDNHVFEWLNNDAIITPLALAVMVGSIQNIIAKGSKYSIWDTSREMLYIPLDNELKTKGKAAVDVVSSKAGKMSSGLVQSMLFVLIPTATYTSISPLLSIVFIVVCIAWIYAVRKIFHEYMKLI